MSAARDSAKEPGGVFWTAKLSGNVARDRRVNRELRKLGWRVVRIWEHDLKRRDEPKLVRRLARLGLIPAADSIQAVS